MSEFKVGEIAIYVRPGSVWHGQEVTIVSGLMEFSDGYDYHLGRKYKSFLGYEYSCGMIDPATGKDAWSASVSELKKKRPPKKQHKRDIDQLVSWSDCLWQPSGVTTCKP